MSANDDQRMKELTERLVAMSPEPPPFPEEVIMTTPVSPKPKRNPVLILAGAAALVLLGAAVPLLLSGDGNGPDPVATTQPTIDTTVPTPTTTPPDQTTQPQVQVPVSYETVVFLVQDPENSFTGDPALVAFLTTVEAAPDMELNSPEVIAEALRLLANPALEMPTPGFWSEVPAGVEVLGVTTAPEGHLIVDMSDEFLAGAGGLLADITMLNQLVYTATQSGADEVLFTVNGQPVEAFGTDGIVLTEPIGRDDHVDSMNLIVITEPFILGGDELPRVAGIANVFEATVSMRIVWAESGEVVYEDFTTATCGSGCWGDFEFFLDTPALEAGQLVQVFWNSAEDGSMSNVVTYPVGPDGAPWNFLPQG